MFSLVGGAGVQCADLTKLIRLQKSYPKIPFSSDDQEAIKDIKLPQELNISKFKTLGTYEI